MPKHSKHEDEIGCAGLSQSYLLEPLVQECEDKIVRDGFLPHMHTLLDGIRRVWADNQGLPFVILSLMDSGGVDYWEPNYDSSLKAVCGVCIPQRLLVRRGLREVLYVAEAWLKTAQGDRIGEVLQVVWRNRSESRWWLLAVEEGQDGKHLAAPELQSSDWSAVQSPLFNPWNTNREIAESCGIPESEFSRFDRDCQRCEQMTWNATKHVDYSVSKGNKRSSSGN